ncbi:MAG: hypothetical protein KF795_11270 [Labilithrix sp.]|nr:hypothetical protein [Labilithrix sp.]
MPARARHDHELIGNLVRRMHDGRSDAVERAGELLGTLAAPAFALTSALRRARTFHPRGDCADADVSIAPGSPAQYRALAERLAGNAFVRFSDALTKKKARWPDVLGCALRFGGEADDPAIDGDQDLLFATIKRPWTMPLSPFTTKVHDYLANDYFAVSPFSVPTPRAFDDGARGARVYFRLRPGTKEPGGLVTIESSRGPISALRASTPKSRQSPAEQRRRRFERAIANGSAVFTLGVANGPWGPFVPLVRIQLVSVRLTDPASLRFDPYRSGRGIEPRGFVHALRRGVYGASQRARSVKERPPSHAPSSIPPAEPLR